MPLRPKMSPRSEVLARVIGGSAGLLLAYAGWPVRSVQGAVVMVAAAACGWYFVSRPERLRDLRRYRFQCEHCGQDLWGMVHGPIARCAKCGRVTSWE
jgi:hypothetical protein